MEKLTSNLADCFIDHRGFLQIKIHCERKNHLDLEESKHLVKNCLQLLEDKKLPMLMDGRNISGTISLSAGEFFVTNPNLRRLTVARAVLLNSLANKLIFNFYLKLSNPEYPVKLFTDEMDAANWLKQFEQNQTQTKI